ncbi:MAG: hypothetical protein H6765_06015 [Candidatus Peribacteria bacterium]|nr:MAG: hypothetical protein H6765_06015 [Candidatus Peribacteria bacterium]
MPSVDFGQYPPDTDPRAQATYRQKVERYYEQFVGVRIFLGTQEISLDWANPTQKIIQLTPGEFV